MVARVVSQCDSDNNETVLPVYSSWLKIVFTGCEAFAELSCDVEFARGRRIQGRFA